MQEVKSLVDSNVRTQLERHHFYLPRASSARSRLPSSTRPGSSGTSNDS
jgi:hypothetical protein